MSDPMRMLLVKSWNNIGNCQVGFEELQLRTSFRAVVSALLAATLVLIANARNARTQSSPVGPQILFLGDRECGDIYAPCLFPRTTALHRYLHIVLHEYARDVEWRVQTSPDDCYYDESDIAGYAAVPADGYLETVVDLSTLEGQSVENVPVCYHFRGLHGYGAMYYTAYFDESPLPDAHVLFPNYEMMAGRPYLPDLDVAYIHRTPAYPYDGHPSAPSVGAAVTYVAHLNNVGALPVPPFTFDWLLDGRRIHEGSSRLKLLPGASTILKTSIRWDGRPHVLALRTFPQGPEISTQNDGLSIRTDALTLGFWAERSAYRYFLDHQWEYCLDRSCAGNDSLDDWLQRNMRYWNRAFARSRYLTLAPAGIADRVRVDQITVVPDGALPLHGGLASNDPDVRDHSVDLEWGMPASGVGLAYLRDRDGPFNVDTGMLHELGHARSLTDVYRFDLPLDGPNIIDVRAADGSPVFDLARPRDAGYKLHVFRADGTDLMLYQNEEHDLMSCVCTPYYSAYDALVLNRLRGRRARCGNANPPCNLGEWLADMPPVARLRVLDGRGQAVADGTTVRLFFDSGVSYTGHTFRQADNLPLSTRAGVVTLPRDPFRTGGSLDRAGHNDVLIEVVTRDTDMVCIEEPASFNLSYWEGYRDVHHPAIFTLQLGKQVNNDCDLTIPPPRINEPFATSPYASSVSVAHSAARYVVTIKLQDDATSHRPMRGRKTRIYDGDATLGTRTTDAAGTVKISVPTRPRRLRVVDLTDNNLEIRPLP